MTEKPSVHEMHADQLLLRTDRKTGIVGYGAYVPRYRLPGTEVARVWMGGGSGTVK
jgi:hydroxymethylglutaryl-CoA synthase